MVTLKEQTAAPAKPLFERMEELADRKGFPARHELRDAARGLRLAIEIQKKVPSAKTIVAEWARARRIWCRYSGEPLI